MKKHSIRSFFAGVLSALLVVGIATSALALSNLETIQCFMGGIRIFIDGQLQIPTDVNGNEVEPLIYNGTTYLPVRALTGMLTDKSVAWDGDTESVYIGLKPGAGEIIRMENMERYSGDGFAKGSDAKFLMMGEEQTPFNRLCGNTVSSTVGQAVYILKEQYTTLQGMLGVSSGAISKNAGGVEVYSMDRQGNVTLLKEYSLAAGEDPIPVSFNIRGCYAIVIRTTKNYTVGECSGDNGVFYNATITKASAG